MTVENLGDLLAKTEEKYKVLTDIIDENHKKTIDFYGKEKDFIIIPTEEIEKFYELYEDRD